MESNLFSAMAGIMMIIGYHPSYQENPSTGTGIQIPKRIQRVSEEGKLWPSKSMLLECPKKRCSKSSEGEVVGVNLRTLHKEGCNWDFRLSASEIQF